VLDRVAGDRDRVADAVARLGREDVDAGPLADDLQLLTAFGRCRSAATSSGVCPAP
jgi:hypothetical protein